MSVTDFIYQIAPLMQKESKARGYEVCSTAIAQAIIESNWGRCSLSKYHNYFGMKCGSSWTGKSVNMRTKEEYKVGVLTSITDCFRAYDSMEDGVKGYYDFIAAKRYANLKTATNYKQYAERLKSDGYATSSTYVQTLCNCVVKHDLTKYDYNSISVDGNFPVLKKGSKGDYVKLLQICLNKEGFSLIPDGCFGNLTQQAVISYQGLHGLVKDGIVGKKTWGALGF